MSSEGTPGAAMIDGQDGRSWHLPLPPLNGATLPEPYSRGEAPERDRLQAAAKMVRNRERVIPFALRGPGQAGPRPVSSPLCDPTAIPALEHTAAMDAALRSVSHALLVGFEAHNASEHAIKVRVPGCPESLGTLEARIWCAHPCPWRSFISITCVALQCTPLSPH